MRPPAFFRATLALSGALLVGSAEAVDIPAAHGGAPAGAVRSAHATVPPGARFVRMPSADGWDIAGWYYAAEPGHGDRAPGIILLHQRGRDKSSWGELPAQLTAQGYAVLAIDLRGHGQTKDPTGRSVDSDALTDADYSAMLGDVAAADRFLAAQPGVHPDRIGIIGASIGANLAVLYLSGDRRIRTAVCLSPGLDYRGLRPLPVMDAVDKRPLYLIAARGDAHSLEAAQQLCAAGVPEGPKSVRLFDGEAHGVDLLAAHPGLDRTISSGWLLNYLPPER